MQSTLPRIGFFAVLISGLRAIVFAPAASAQTLPPAQATAGAQAPVGRAWIGSLGDIVDDLIWNADLHGPLLIVSPEQTKNYDNISRPDGSIVEHSRRPQPVPEANGRFRLEVAGAYFDRRVVKVASVSVFAPTEMTVLNTTHLPKPDPFAGMLDQEKIQLMLSTFTANEWRALGSAEGIGAADMTATQRSLYLSVLPEPFAVHTIAKETHSDGRQYIVSTDPIALTAEQREAVRFSVYRELQYFFDDGHGGGQGIAPWLDDHGPILQIYSNRPAVGPKNAAFGAILREETAARSKAGQLDFDWSALDTSIPIDNALTVGSLVARIAQATHAELYCDPRYRDRKLYVRGTTASARAGDLLHALALAVTGTWRRLDNAFVLTDDLEGLGVRHAAIAEWIQENRLLRYGVQVRTGNVMRGKDAIASIGFPASDPRAPSEALSKKISDHENDLNVARGPLHISSSELSPAAQAYIRNEAKAATARVPASPDYTPPVIRTDVIEVFPATKAVFLVPGIGSVDAPGIGLGAMLRSADSDVRPGTAAPAAEGPSFPVGPSVRALIVAPITDAESAMAVREAKERGFTEIWIQAPTDKPDLVAGAVRAGRANGLAVRLVIRLLRADPSAKPDQLDRNIAGQTLTEYAKSWQERIASLKGADLYVPSRPETPFSNWGADWTRDQVVRELISEGDYFRPDDPAVETALVANLDHAASVKGVAGVVVRDVSAPGYAATVYAPVIRREFGGSFSNDPLLGLGYSDSMRLAFLRKFGVDPIDLSPLEQGYSINTGTGVEGYISLQLPFFSDSGNDGVVLARIGMGGGEKGVGDSLASWCAFRASASAGLVERAITRSSAARNGLPILVRHEADRLGDAGTYYGSVEPPETDRGLETPQKVITAAPRPAKTMQRKLDFGFVRPSPESAHETSKHAYYPITLFVDSADVASEKARFRDRLVSDLKNSAAWDGVVIDLSAVSVTDAIDVLGVLPVETTKSNTQTRQRNRSILPQSDSKL